MASASYPAHSVRTATCHDHATPTFELYAELSDDAVAHKSLSPHAPTTRVSLGNSPELSLLTSAEQSACPQTVEAAQCPPELTVAQLTAPLSPHAQPADTPEHPNTPINGA